MKTYEIKMLDAVPADFSAVARAEMNEFVWMKEYTPVCYAQIVFVKGDGFYAKLTCEEENPTAVFHNFFDDVYKDSCLEFFAAYDNKDSRYVNIEMNSNGACLIAVGPDRYDRTPIDKIVGKPFTVTAEKKEKEWSVTAHITLADLQKIYGIAPDTFEKGYTFHGNFYKCGDETPVVHYGMWNPVGTPEPDYHRPEFFGNLVLA